MILNSYVLRVTIKFPTLPINKGFICLGTKNEILMEVNIMQKYLNAIDSTLRMEPTLDNPTTIVIIEIRCVQ